MAIHTPDMTGWDVRPGPDVTPGPDVRSRCEIRPGCVFFVRPKVERCAAKFHAEPIFQKSDISVLRSIREKNVLGHF